MRVALESRGGFTGLRLSASLDTDDLPEADASEAVRTLQELASAPPAPAPSNALPRYRLSIDLAGDTRVLELAESQVPPGLRPLLTELLGRATGTSEQR